MSFLPPEFAEFVAPQTDRCLFLTNWLEAHCISYSVITIENSRHIFINFPTSCYDPMFRIKTLLIHYDRAPNSPGANDNSAAVFQLLSFIQKLKTRSAPHNLRIIFTDGEEMGAMNGVSDQGAFGIAARFKKLGIINDDIIAIDSCGRGDVLVISSTGRKNSGSASFNRRLESLYERTLKLASEVSTGKWVTLPVPYSDNAAFIASGIPAIAITVLPKEEASDLMRNLQRNKKLEAELLTHNLTSTDILPLTWRFMHTPFDTPESLTEESFVLMEKFLDKLAADKTLV